MRRPVPEKHSNEPFLKSPRRSGKLQAAKKKNLTMPVIASSLALRRTIKHLHSATVAENLEDLRDGMLG